MNPLTTILRFAPLAALALALMAGRAEAQDRVSAEVIVVLAKESAGTVDPALADIPALQRAPFNAFQSMEILDRKREQLRAGVDRDVALPNGRTLRIRLQRVMPDGRYRVQVSINRPEADAYLPLLQVVTAPGDPFFVAGQSYRGGTLVIGVRVGSTSG
ncbi:MAG: hypothetical protein JJ863_02705 [Deltaproteobacteria bacterium]|nr:hypothetical protein [Deltaproteobacteria bacterium]